MTSAVKPAAEHTGVRTLVGGGAILGALTAVGVVVFALLTRALDGIPALVVQSLIVLVGALLAAYLPAILVRPHNVDGIAWAALVGLLGALTFTVVDTAVLRPLSVYSWKWDAIGGGSGFWYVSIWWMCAAVLAWLGAWIFALGHRGDRAPSVTVTAGATIGLAAIVFAALTLSDIVRPGAAIVALAFSIALVAHLVVSAAFGRR